MNNVVWYASDAYLIFSKNFERNLLKDIFFFNFCDFLLKVIEVEI